MRNSWIFCLFAKSLLFCRLLSWLLNRLYFSTRLPKKSLKKFELTFYCISINKLSNNFQNIDIFLKYKLRKNSWRLLRRTIHLFNVENLDLRQSFSPKMSNWHPLECQTLLQYSWFPIPCIVENYLNVCQICSRNLLHFTISCI